MFGIDVSIINGTVPEEHSTFSVVSRFHPRDVPDSSYLIFQTQARENYELY